MEQAMRVFSRFYKLLPLDCSHNDFDRACYSFSMMYICGPACFCNKQDGSLQFRMKCSSSLHKETDLTVYLPYLHTHPHTHIHMYTHTNTHTHTPSLSLSCTCTQTHTHTCTHSLKTTTSTQNLACSQRQIHTLHACKLKS